jgi:hypothetical protein
MSEEKKKYCPFSFANPETVDRCSDDCKWYVDGKCLMEILVVNLGCLVEVLNRMYFHEKYGGR